MATHRHIGRICLAALALALLLCAGLYAARAAGVRGSRTLGYQTRLFDTGTVHTIDIRMDDWQTFLAGCEDEEYAACAVLIDNELYKNIGLRAKGNTSLSQVAAYGNGRYSFKLEFDHYEAGKTYYGLDKLCLNNLIQDNTLMKDYLCYTMMADMGVAAPLCSYVWVTVNGEPFGLYLAVEAIEDAFLYRSYGGEGGQLYKPDSVDMGGGRGAGRNFVWQDEDGGTTQSQEMPREGGPGEMPEEMPAPPEGEMPEDMPAPPDDFAGDFGDFGGAPFGEADSGNDRGGGGFGGGFGASEDVLLQYIDDEVASYLNIFENAKTAVTDADCRRLIHSLKNLSEQTDLENTVDTEQVIRYFAVHNFVCNFDSYTGGMVHNYYLYEQDGRLSMLPWDYNLAFGGFASAGGAQELVNYPIDTPVSGQGMEARPMLSWIFSDEACTAQYHAALEELIARWFDEGRFAAEIERLAALLDAYVAQDTNAFCGYEAWQQALQALRQFGSLRAKSVQAQLTGEIPSTQQDRSAADDLVDAGDLSIDDMGGMNAGGGIGSMGGGPGGDFTGGLTNDFAGGPGGDFTGGFTGGPTDDFAGDRDGGGSAAPPDQGGLSQSPPDFSGNGTTAPSDQNEMPQSPPDFPGSGAAARPDQNRMPQSATIFTPQFWLLTGLCVAALTGSFVLRKCWSRKL